MLTSYEDAKVGKIRNKWIILALIYALAAYSIISVYSYFTTGLKYDYLLELLTNLLFVIMVGFGAWYFGLWTAGDGKLFIAFSALIPLSTYKTGYQAWIPSLTLLINIFIPSAIIMLIWILFKIKMKDIKKVSKSFFKEFFQPKTLINSIIFLFAIFWGVELVLSLLGFDNNLLTIVLTMLIFPVIQKKLGKKSLYIMLAISLIRFIVDKSVYSLSFLTDILILIFVCGFFRSFLRGSVSKLGQEIFSKEVKVGRLKPGMILSEVIQKKEKITKDELDEFKKSPDTEIIKHKEAYYIKKPKSPIELNNFIGEEAEGLTGKQIKKIKMLGIRSIRVSQTIPFAPFIFFGVLLTIIAKGNILIVVKNLI